MRTITIDDSMAPQPPCVATIGFFDGVHRGHAFLIGNIVDEARRLGIEATVITFSEHPRKVLHDSYQPRMLTTGEEKQRLFAATGIDCCAVLPFDKDMAAMTAHDFITGVLHDRLNVRVLYIGYDNRFGHNRDEGFDDYVRYGRECGISVRHAGAFTTGGDRPVISSSVIRKLIAGGDVSGAAECLGYPYFMTGMVVPGVRKGRTIGFPTANMRPADADKIVPAPGVYAVRVTLQGETERRRGMMNIGRRPTFDNGAMTMEINIFDFADDIYGRSIDVAFVGKLRDEHRFASAGELARQLIEDRKAAESLLEKEK